MAKTTLLLTLTFLLPPLFPSYGAEKPIHLAAASNFTAPLNSLIEHYENEQGQKVILSTGSTGKLYAQIINGAPFHIFLAADQRRPQLLTEKKAALPHSQFTYAIGKLALFSNEPAFAPVSQKSLFTPDLKRLALANPKTAPYGSAARDVLKSLSLGEKPPFRFVRGENIAQTYQFVASRSVKLGFVALSQVQNQPKDKVWLIPQDYYSPIYQDAVLLQPARNHPQAQAFFRFLQSAKARKIIQSFGYGTP